MSLVTTWTTEEDIIGCKISQAEREKHYPFLLIGRRGAEGAEAALGGK